MNSFSTAAYSFNARVGMVKRSLTPWNWCGRFNFGYTNILIGLNSSKSSGALTKLL